MSNPPSPAPTGLWARVGVLTPRGRVDLALPSDVPVAELVPMVLELIAEPSGGRRAGAAGSGREAQASGRGVPLPWRFSGPAGGPLPPEATLSGLGVLDGELLHFGPRRTPLPSPVFDDPADALAASVRESGDADAATRWAGPLAALAVVTGASVALTTVHGSGVTPVVLAAVMAVLGAVAALVLCARTLSRAAADGDDPNEPAEPHVLTPRFRAQAAALAAVPPAAAAGVLALPGPLGAGHLLLASAAAGLAAVCGQTVLRTVSAPLLSISAAAVGLVGASVARLALDAPSPAVGAGLTAVTLAVGPLLPRIALRLAGVPDPTVPGDLDEISKADTPALPGPEMTERAALARGLFAGLSAPCALLAAGGSVLAAGGGGWTGPVLAAVTVAVLLLRARAFAEAGPARVLGAAAVLATVGTAVPVALAHGSTTRLVVAAVLGAATLVAAGTSSSAMSPVGRRTLDVLELVLTAAAIPAAIAAMGLFALVRGA